MILSGYDVRETDTSCCGLRKDKAKTMDYMYSTKINIADEVRFQIKPTRGSYVKVFFTSVGDQ